MELPKDMSFSQTQSSSRHLTNKEKIYQIVKKKIIDGLFFPGQYLRISALASDMKVSPTPVREALNQLEGEGFIEFLPYRGAIVRGLSKDEVREIYTIRSILECAALERAIPNLTVEIAAKADRILESIKGESDPDVLNEQNWVFHSLIFGCSKMPILCSMIESLRSRVIRYLRLYYTVYADHFYKEHKYQLEVYIRGDVSQAIQVRQKNINKVMDILLKLVPATKLSDN